MAIQTAQNDKNHGAVSYTKDTHAEYRAIAENLKAEFNPSTAIDIGCGDGSLVSAFRDIGVECFGVEKTARTIAQVSDNIKEFVFVHDLTSPLPESMPRHFDLVTCFDVAEHLPEESADAFISRLCDLGETIIFSSNPHDLEDPAHVNVQQAEYWCKRFAAHGFFRRADIDVNYPTPWAICFVRREHTAASVVAEYERIIRIGDTRRSKQNYTALAFFDRGNGFDTENPMRFTYVGGSKIEQTFYLEGVKALRIVPQENIGWLASGIMLQGTSNTILPSYSNGIHASGMIAFPEPDAFLDFNFSDCNMTSAVFHAQFTAFSPTAMTAFLQGVKNDVLSSLSTIRQENARLLAQIEQNGLEHKKELYGIESAYKKEISAIRINAKRSVDELHELEERSAEQLKKAQEKFQIENTKLLLHSRELQQKYDALYAKADVLEKEAAALRVRNTIAELEIENIRSAMNESTQQAQTAQAQLIHMTFLYNEVNARYNEILNAFWWKITKPGRNFGTSVKKLIAKNDSLFLFVRTAKHALTLGPAEAIRRRNAYIAERANSVASLPSLPVQPIAAIKVKGIEIPGITEDILNAQRRAKFPKNIKFSILVPLYNTPEQFLREMIHSVQYQTYENWELCLADGSDSEHKYVGKLCKKYAAADKRIRYKALKSNMGISGNTNACIEMATGDYLALFDHDDLLHPCALYENMKAICEKNADFIYTDENTFHDKPTDAFCPHFKPDFAPDTLRANNYICHFTVFKSDLIAKAGGGFRPECDGSQDFDMVLRLTEQAEHVVHIPKILYYWRAHKNSVAENVSAKPYVIDAAKKAVSDHLKRVGLEGEVLDSRVPSMYRLKYKIQGEPLISILIPNKDHIDDLDRCLESIFTKSTYQNYEIIIIENNSTEHKTFRYYTSIQEKDPRVHVVKWAGSFNYSAINNFGFQHAKGEHILLLNNDVEIISPDWLQEMLMYSQRSDIGGVGVKLYYPDHTIQHAGIGIGILTLAGHYHKHFDGNHPGYMGRLSYSQNLSAVTAACMMIPRHVFEELDGLDETFEVAFNDVDLCMRIRKAGYLIVFTPFAELTHYESKSRGSDEAPEKRARFIGEVNRFQKRWAVELAAGDPYYNPNFSLEKEDFSVLPEGLIYR